MSDNKNKACIYCRVATPGDTDSLELQRMSLLNAAEKKGWDVVQEICEYGNGLTIDRPGVEELLKRARASEFSNVLVKDIMRISRNPVNATRVVRDLMNLGIRVATPDDQQITRELMASIINEYLDELGIPAGKAKKS